MRVEVIISVQFLVGLMSPCGSTLKVVAGDAFGVASGVFTLGGGVTCGGRGWSMVNISSIFFNVAV